MILLVRFLSWSVWFISFLVNQLEGACSEFKGEFINFKALFEGNGVKEPILRDILELFWYFGVGLTRER